MQPQINVYDGVNQDPQHPLGFLAFPASDQAGEFVAAGDFENRGVADILVGTGPVNSPEVKIFQANNGVKTVADFTAFTAVPTFGSSTPNATSFPGVSSVAFGARNPSNGNLLDVFVGVGVGGIGEINGNKALGFDLAPNTPVNGVLSQAAVNGYFELVGRDTPSPFLNGIQFAGVVTGPNTNS
jgi:hypothetical protein